MSESCLADIMAPWVFLDGDQGPDHHDYYWHRYTPDHDEWLSLWVDKKGWGEWWLEVYPSPEFDEKRENRRSFDTREEAAQFVADFMEEHS
jgi:hypothetical protein